MKTKDKIIVLSIFVVLIALITGGVVWSKYNFQENQIDEKVSSSDIIINIGQIDESKMAVKSTADDNAALSEEATGSVSSSYECETAGEVPASIVSGAGLVEKAGNEDFIKRIDTKQQVVNEEIGKNEEDEAEGVKNLVLLHAFEQENIAVYYYEYQSLALNDYGRILKRIAIEHDGIYQNFNININDDMTDPDMHSFGCYDYDGDGDLEVALVLCYGENKYYGYMDERLFIFDLNSETREYNLYALKNSGCFDIVENGVIKYFSEKYGEECSGTGYATDGIEEISRNYSVGWGNNIDFGQKANVSLYDNGEIEVGFTIRQMIYDAYDGDSLEAAEWFEAGEMVCGIDYRGNGEFVIDLLGYKEY